jgi:hypothetical protein
MGKRIVLLPRDPQRTPPQKAPDGASKPGDERRANPRRSGLPRRVEPDRRRPARSGSRKDADHRGGVRRSVADRRRHRDRRFGLDPTLYDRLDDLDL